jgi:uncharacterized protein YoxC
MKRSTIVIAAIAAACALLFAAIYALRVLHSMDVELGRVSARLDSLTQVNDKLGQTNHLLQTTNASLLTMIGASTTANKKLGAMQADLSVMSHKISGSFLFRGVK